MKNKTSSFHMKHKQKRQLDWKRISVTAGIGMLVLITLFVALSGKETSTGQAFFVDSAIFPMQIVLVVLMGEAFHALRYSLLIGVMEVVDILLYLC